jgi:NAD(P)-dependent dehydrogenase (short-subunit alcohol dehydrogenase family)
VSAKAALRPKNGIHALSAFTDRVALVTGATSGIGRATALAFAREGAKLVVSGRREAEGADTVRLIHAAGGEGTFVRTDVVSESDVEALVKAACSVYGRLDFAFNNAGIGEGSSGPVHEKPAEVYDRVMNTNVRGVFLCLKHEVAAMLGFGGGAIVNSASVSGLVGFPGAAAYVASKHAVIGLTKSAALDYASHGIRINAIAPGGTDTPLLDRITGGSETDRRRDFIGFHPMGRIGNPEEIAEAVLWLCSDRSSFTTGHTLVADGGWTAR